jgi:hypothetical protein
MRRGCPLTHDGLTKADLTGFFYNHYRVENLGEIAWIKAWRLASIFADQVTRSRARRSTRSVDGDGAGRFVTGSSAPAKARRLGIVNEPKSAS